jgi:ATP-dependent DNA ligase
MRLLRIPEPFDHPQFLYEVKFDGFRAWRMWTATTVKSWRASCHGLIHA